MRRFQMRRSTSAVPMLLAAAQADGVILVMAERPGSEYHLTSPGRGLRMVTVGDADVPAFLAGIAYATSPPPKRLSALLGQLYRAWPYDKPPGPQT